MIEKNDLIDLANLLFDNYAELNNELNKEIN